MRRRSGYIRLILLLAALPLAALAGLLDMAAAPVARATGERSLELGRSAEGRPIEVVIFGDGPRKLVVVGDTHGGPEANTYLLTLALVEHFRANPGQVPAGVRLALIPTLNPDGLARGWRFDAAGVDLNRNMDTSHDACPENDWRPTVQGARGIVSDTGGPYADSQVESRLIRAFLLDAAGAIFLHSNAGLVFPAACEHPPSIAMAEAYAGAAGYVYARVWDRYTITGGMHDWAGGLGIAAITPELLTGDQPEVAENLAGLLAVLARAEELLPLPAAGAQAGVPLPAPIDRYWRAMGGAARFGPPLGPASAAPAGLRQRFLRAEIVVDEALRDTAFYIQPAPLGAAAAADLAYGGAAALAAPAEPPPGAARFAETGHAIAGPLADYWRRGGGLAAFGYPLSAEFPAALPDGARRTAQYFERAVLLLDPATGAVELAPLGARAAELEALLAPVAQQSAR